MSQIDVLAIALGVSGVVNLLLLWALYEAREDLALATEVIDLIEQEAPHDPPQNS